MRIGVISVFVDYHRRGAKNRISLQPQIGPLIAGLLPRDVEIDVVNETWRDPDWHRDYDLLFLSALHSDFDRARQLSHYWRRRGAKTVFGGPLASHFPDLCQPWFDAVVVGDAEGVVPEIYRDFSARKLRARYESRRYDPTQLRTPRFDLLLEQSIHPLVLEASRGCPFTCEFCVLTGLGTRYHSRSVDEVVRDIVRGRELLAPRLPFYKRSLIGFADNNLGGSVAWLRELCRGLTPFKAHWYGAASFNVIANRELVALMACSGCRGLFVGIESFNPAALADMGKHQNALAKVKGALADCLAHGIIVVSGLLVSPLADDVETIRAIPRHLADSGLKVPTFLAFETPIPGTPLFHRLASERGAFLPNALLRDFAGYTLVTRPRHASVDEFIAAYRETEREVFGLRRRLAKLAHDAARLLARGYWFPALIGAVDLLTMQGAQPPLANRTFLAGTDAPPPERVPFDASDFDSEKERDAVLSPWQVTDSAGDVLDSWRRARPIFERGRRDSLTRAIPT
jgi:radical SAM superfamily enzyme YgiQ (UPF0313 family)